MNRVGGDRVHHPEVPAPERTLHDLEAMRDPVDALQDRRLVARHRRGAGEVELDLWLDPGLDQVTDADLRRPRFRVLHRCVVYVAPDRCVQSTLRPERLVGETDLAPDRPLSAFDPAPVHLTGDGICTILVERGVAVA